MADEETRSGMLELWSWAGMAANELARGHEWGGDFTVEEREGGVENVVTGLRRKFADEGNDEEEEEEEGDEEAEKEAGGEDKMEVVKAERGAEGVGLKITKGQEGGAIEPRDPLPLEQVLKFMMTGIEPKI